MALSPFKAKSMADQGIANPYFEDEDVSTIVIKSLCKYRGQITSLG
jgi:hypothetical protein